MSIEKQPKTNETVPQQPEVLSRTDKIARLWTEAALLREGIPGADLENEDITRELDDALNANGYGLENVDSFGCTEDEKKLLRNIARVAEEARLAGENDVRKRAREIIGRVMRMASTD